MATNRRTKPERRNPATSRARIRIPPEKSKRKPSGRAAVATKPTDRLTPDLIVQFCAMFQRGLPADGVCDYLGIPPGTFWKWIRRGAVYIDAGCTPKSDSPYGDFVFAFRRATAEFRLGHIEKLTGETTGSNWVREMTILERRDRKNWSRYDQPGGSDESTNPDEKFI